MALDSPDAWAIGEGTVIGAGVSVKLVGCAREGQCAHRWGREKGQCCQEIGRAWVRQLRPGESKRCTAHRLFPVWPGNLGDLAGRAWMWQPGPGKGERRVARRLFRMA